MKLIQPTDIYKTGWNFLYTLLIGNVIYDRIVFNKDN